jgi:hypothetical protein
MRFTAISESFEKVSLIYQYPQQHWSAMITYVRITSLIGNELKISDIKSSKDISISPIKAIR